MAIIAVASWPVRSAQATGCPDSGSILVYSNALAWAWTNYCTNSAPTSNSFTAVCIKIQHCVDCSPTSTPLSVTIYSLTGGSYPDPGEYELVAQTSCAGLAPAWVSIDNFCDGIPLWWRIQHFPNDWQTIDSTNCAICDPDGDCFNNLEEYRNGTDPLKPDPMQTITSSTVYANSGTNTVSAIPNLVPVYSFNGASPRGMMQSKIDSNFYGVAYLDNGDYTYDYIFKMTPQGTVLPLYTFSTVSNGLEPLVPIQGNDGNFYGECDKGGSEHQNVCYSTWYGYGTIFRLTPEGVLSNLYVFPAAPGGSCPVGGLIQGQDGSFYGVTQYGGSNNCWFCTLYPGYGCGDPCFLGYGTVFKLTPQGILTNLYAFSAGPDGAFPAAGLLQGSDRYLYGTTTGYTNNWGSVFKISTDGTTFVTLHTFSGGIDGGSPEGTLIQDSSGSLYGTTASGGTSGGGTVFMITTNGEFTPLYSFAGSPDGYSPQQGLVQGSDGNFYGTTVWGGLGGGWGYGTLFRITPQGILTPIYEFTGGADGGLPGIASTPLAQSVLDGYFYGTTFLGGNIFKYGIVRVYTWTVNGGTLLAGQSSAYPTFTASSVCPVTLDFTASNSGLSACSNSGSITVTQMAPPPSANSPVPVGGTLTLSVPSVAGAAYAWTGPNGFTSTDQNPSIGDVQPCAAGQYCVAVNASGCTSLTNCVSVVVTAPQPTSNSPICEGQTLNLSVSGGPDASYSWTGPNFSSTDQNPSIENAPTSASGVYCVAVTVNGCTGSTNYTSCTSVTVKPQPAALVSNAPALICLMGGQATISASLQGVSPWTVTWSDGVVQSNLTHNLVTRTVGPPSTQTYTITSVSDANCSGGFTSGSTTVTVNSNGTSSVVVSNEVLVVYNSNANFPDSSACKDYYINHRPGFADANVLACNCTTYGVGNVETISAGDLTNQIINPIINFILSKTNIHYVVLMYDMPSRVDDGCSTGCPPPSVQHRISRCMQFPPVFKYFGAIDTGWPYYEGSNCPFVATNYPGTTCLVTALNMATLADCEAYIDKVASMYRSNVIISASEAGYANSTYYLDDYPGGCPSDVAASIQAQNPNASITCSSNAVITTGSCIRGYISRGMHSGELRYTYAIDGSIRWLGSSNSWWIIETRESYNGMRDCGDSEGQDQGCVARWFSASAWGGTNYENTPVGAVSHVEEPLGVNVNIATAYFGMWEMGYLFSECAWASRHTACFQAIGDPLVRK